MSAVPQPSPTPPIALVPPLPAETVVLIDLSSIAHPIYHMSQGEPDPNHASIQTVAKVRALASGQRRVAICCDSGRSFRYEIDATYKGNRPERDEVLQHQITLARETLTGDGFPVWAVPGFEADDLIATGTKLARDAGFDVLVVSSDKDLLQLVGPGVNAKSVKDGAVIDADAVAAKFGVRPDQMRDYLCLVGDTADNVKGAVGIGPKRAVSLLLKFNSLDALYAEIKAKGAAEIGLKPAEAASLAEFEARYPTVRRLIALRDDAPVPFSEITADRVPKEATKLMEEVMEQEMATLEAEVITQAQAVPLPAPAAPAALAVREPQEVLAVPAEWERQLDPRSMDQAKRLAADLFASRLFSAYGTPQAVLSTVMLGRELGLPAMASLRSVHIVEGRHALSASLMAALVLRSGLAEYFEPIEFDDTKATFETKRKGARNPVRLTHTLEMAKTAGLVKDKSGWMKNPTDMLVARAQARLARLVYPDLFAGLYAPEELADMRAERVDA